MGSLDINNIVQIVATALLTTILTSLVTYFFSTRKERRKRIQESSAKLLDNVYTPIIQILNNSVYPAGDYELTYKSAIKITDIINNHINIVDPKLMNFYWILKEEIGMIGDNGGHYYNYDGKHELFEFIEYKSNLLKKKINREYDSCAIKLKKIPKGK